MEKNSHPAFGTPGASSLMVIFAVLCIAVFAVLSLSTVLSGKRLDETATNSSLEYYIADCYAEELLARIRAGEKPENVGIKGNLYDYSVPISETRAIEVQVMVDKDKYEILKWQVVYTGDWSADEKMSVWTGE